MPDNYSLNWLLAEQQKHQLKYIFFWGHQPHPQGIITASCFSQWWEAPFTVDQITYATAEHWMMAEKARLCGDTEMASRIISCRTAPEAKKLGREVRNFDEEKWLACRFEIVCTGNFHKFSQHENLKKFLLQTGDRIIVEASPVDAIWGIGLATDHRDASFPERWKGLNLLGFALMEVRDRLRG